MDVYQQRNCITYKFQCKISFQIMTFCFPLNTPTFDIEEYYLDVNYKVNDARALKNLYHHCSFVWRFEIATHV